LGAAAGAGVGRGEEATESSSLFLYEEREKKVGTRVASLGMERERGCFDRCSDFYGMFCLKLDTEMIQLCF
jgi:hypothetical protein